VLHPAGEPAYGGRVVARPQQRLGQQAHRADRGLELVADVGDEVASYGLHPPGLGDVLDQQHDVSPVADRCEPGPDRLRDAAEPRRRELDLGLVRLPAAPRVPHEPAQLGHRQPAGSDDADLPGGAVVDDHVVRGVQHRDGDLQGVDDLRGGRGARAERVGLGRPRAPQHHDGGGAACCSEHQPEQQAQDDHEANARRELPVRRRRRQWPRRCSPCV